MKVVIENREDPTEEHVEFGLPKKGAYKWMNPFVKSHFSKFRWSRILNS